MLNPTKVRVGEIDKASNQVSLLEATRRRVVLLAPPVPVTATSSEGNMTESIDRLFDEGNGAEKEHSTEGCEYVSLMEAIVQPMNEDVAEKPRRLKKKRKASGDASGAPRPAIKASHSALLLVASNLNLKAYVDSAPSRFVSIIPALEPSTQDDPSMNSVYGSEVPSSLPWVCLEGRLPDASL
nr:hypothetical protein [Tanacetum cinerariifolium]